MLNVYVLIRDDDWKYDSPVEQTIVAPTAKRAIEMASNRTNGIWKIDKVVDLNVEQILTVEENYG